MKIEKISDNQIRCTLNKDDLLDRELRISELAYGTEKAKALFRDMMQQASYEFGFEAEDIPLMIEAIPVSSDCLVLVITKVENPDELDTRFSKFTSSSKEDTDSEEEAPSAFADEIINCFDQINDILDDVTADKPIEESVVCDPQLPLPEALKEAKQKKKQSDESNSSATQAVNLTKIFSFSTLDDIINLSKHISLIYNGKNTIYKDHISIKYYLVLNKSNHTPEEFNKICNTISEFAKPERATYASLNYFDEHFHVIIKNKAVQVLSSL